MKEDGKITFSFGNVRGNNTGACTRIDEYKCEVGSAQTPTWLADEELLRVKEALNGQRHERLLTSVPSGARRQDARKSLKTPLWWLNLAILGIILGWIFVPLNFDVFTGKLPESEQKQDEHIETLGGPAPTKSEHREDDTKTLSGAVPSTLGGLTMYSTCTQYNAASAADRVGLVADLIEGTSITTGRNYRAHWANIQTCVAATLAPPCAANMPVREVMALCLIML